MRVFAISDLHLSFARPKPMTVFGPQWEDHAGQIAANWREVITADDLVLLAGDFSWALKLEEAGADLDWLSALPGRKVMIKGNHDYWWSGLGKIKKRAGPDIDFIQNNVLLCGDLAIGGTRLWDFPETAWTFSAAETAAVPADSPAGNGQKQEVDPEVVRRREIERLRLSLQKLPPGKVRIAMTHFPPVGAAGQPTPLTAIMDEFAIDICVFGHLHGLSHEARPGADCRLGRTRYLLTSCDWLDFKPLEITF